MKYQDRTTANEFTAAYQDPSGGTFTIDPVRNTNVAYREHIGSAYLLASRALDPMR